MDVVEITRTYGFGGPGSSLVNVTIIGIIICSILVINRIFWRLKGVRSLGIDDYFIITSMLLLFVLGGIALTAVNYGYGRTQHELSPSEVKNALLLTAVTQTFYLYQLVYKINIATTKLSVISLYLRIFHDKKWFRITCSTTALIVILYTTTAVLVNILECRPVNYAWDKTISSPYSAQIMSPSCINITAFWLTTATVNLTTELVILSATVFVVIKLNLPPRQKTGLVAIFLLGIFVFITSVLRVTTLHPNRTPKNITGGTYHSTVWSTIEASTAITCACLPMLRAPIQKWIPELFGRLSSHHSRSRSTRTARSSERLTSMSDASTLPTSIYEPGLSHVQIPGTRLYLTETTDLNETIEHEVESRPPINIHQNANPTIIRASSVKNFTGYSDPYTGTNTFNTTNAPTIVNFSRSTPDLSTTISKPDQARTNINPNPRPPKRRTYKYSYTPSSSSLRNLHNPPPVLQNIRTSIIPNHTNIQSDPLRTTPIVPVLPIEHRNTPIMNE